MGVRQELTLREGFTSSYPQGQRGLLMELTMDGLAFCSACHPIPGPWGYGPIPFRSWSGWALSRFVSGSRTVSITLCEKAGREGAGQGPPRHPAGARMLSGPLWGLWSIQEDPLLSPTFPDSLSSLSPVAFMHCAFHLFVPRDLQKNRYIPAGQGFSQCRTLSSSLAGQGNLGGDRAP